MTNTGPLRASGGQQASALTPDEPAPDMISQAVQVTGPLPGSAPGEEGLRLPRSAAAVIDIALLAGLFLVMGGAVGRNSVQTGFGVSRSWAAPHGRGRAIWA